MESLKSQDMKATTSLLWDNLEEYQKTMLNNSSPTLVNNYTDAVVKLLETQNDKDNDDIEPLTEITLDDPLKYFRAYKCQGRYENCKNSEVKENILKSVFSSADIEREHESEHNSASNKDKIIDSKTSNIFAFRKSLCSTSSPMQNKINLNLNVNPPDTAVYPSAVNEISKRIFTPGSLNFNAKPTKIFANNSGKIENRREEVVEIPSYTTPTTSSTANSFRTAKDELQIQNVKKYGNPGGKTPLFAYGKKSLGGRRTLQSKFICPIKNDDGETSVLSQHSSGGSQSGDSQEEEVDERLKHIDPKMVELIRSEIMVKFASLNWDDIAGLEYAKTTIKEAVVWPILRPDIFTGLRKPPRGVLLFGPPGTGKTLIGKCIASQSKSTFFSISASSLTSKWVGDGEKMVRALFAVAAVHQPAVVFIDEIDSLLCKRSESEHESSRRLKTEFLIQLDGTATTEDERILIVGATNRPQELDEAARRRLVKRLYIPLPECDARMQILKNLLGSVNNSLKEEQIEEIGNGTSGFSGADMKVLCHEAAMGPIRAIPFEQMHSINRDDVRPVNFDDFKTALTHVRSSVSPDDLIQYVKWDQLYGSGAAINK